MTGNTVIAFVLGAIVGAAAALLLAPQSGEELRAQLRREAEMDQERIRNEYKEAVREVQARVDKVHGDVQEALQQAQAKADEAAASKS